MSDDAPVPTGVAIAGCWAYPPLGPGGKPENCPGPVAWTGLILSKRQRDRPAQAWQVFTCARHADGLTARRRLLPRDWELLARWQAEARRCRPGHPRRPTREDPWVPPRPLAEGDAAHELFDRARQWAMTHPDQ